MAKSDTASVIGRRILDQLKAMLGGIPFFESLPRRLGFAFFHLELHAGEALGKMIALPFRLILEFGMEACFLKPLENRERRIRIIERHQSHVFHDPKLRLIRRSSNGEDRAIGSSLAFAGRGL